MPAPLRRYAAPAAALLLALTACSGGDEQRPVARPAPSSTAPSSSATTPTTTPTAPPTGGTAEEPVVLPPEVQLLDWRPVPGSVDDTVTRSGDWTLTVNEAGTRAELEGPDSSSGYGSSDERISDAFIDGQYAVVVFQDKQETRPNRAEVTNLANGRGFTVDGSSEIPTTTGGSWALGQGRLLHATVDKGSYCLASVDLATRRSTRGWCAPARHGFNSARITPAGDSLLTFDDSQPACRTVVSVSGSDVQSFPGVPECQGWDGLLVDGGAAWSVIPKENQIETAHFYARSADGYFDLGLGTSGSLTWCADAAYFVRDPQRDGDPAALMRWSPDDGLAVTYRSPGGQAFLSEPRCGGDTMTVTALAERGDEQVSATLR
ncbi:MAG TPA: hypothetical protein VFT00_10060 [Nocardioides sp.]|nr:hypothetical protein [Nocardioides sp.]